MTKRRKVWVSGKFDSGIKLFPSKKKALAYNAAYDPVCLIEHKLGDAILPRHVDGAIKIHLECIKHTLKALCVWDDLVRLDAIIGLLNACRNRR